MPSPNLALPERFRNLRRLLLRRPPSTVALAERAVRHGHLGDLPARLGRRFGRSVEVRVSPHGMTAEEVLWEVAGRSCRFTFDPGVFAHLHGTALLERWLDTLPLLLGAPACDAWPTGTTSLALGDCGTGRGLAFCDHRVDARLIPDPVFLRDDGYGAQKRSFAQIVPWDRRQPRALWRGQSSGWHDATGRVIARWQDLPRVRLCGLAQDPAHAQLIDAGLTGIVQIEDPAAAEEMRVAGLLVPRLDWRRFPEWRYAIDIDGNASAWEGLFVKLCTGSTVLKVASGFGFRQWYYDRLVPWTHVVPVSADLADLVDKVRWLRAHDAEARRIGAAATALVADMDFRREAAGAAETMTRALRDGL